MKRSTHRAVDRFGVSIERSLLDRFDRQIARKGYTNRSEALRDLIRDHLVEQEWTAGKEVVGALTLLYDHDVRELAETLGHFQHRAHALIRSTLHVHLDERHCLEVLVITGEAGAIREIADRLIGTRGVKHGKLTMTSTGKALT
jgi:CopG family nickel-responsive transcriptional regulator